jgi:hypothetical protein
MRFIDIMKVSWLAKDLNFYNSYVSLQSSQKPTVALSRAELIKFSPYAAQFL